jgi:hypothetical protein
VQHLALLPARSRISDRTRPTLSYALDTPVIMSISTGSLKAGSKADVRVTLKIDYLSMTSAGCTPESSCGT